MRFWCVKQLTQGRIKWRALPKKKMEFQVDINKEYEGWNFNSGNYLFTTDTK